VLHQIAHFRRRHICSETRCAYFSLVG
jgi:hypothetical protein